MSDHITELSKYLYILRSLDPSIDGRQVWYALSDRDPQLNISTDLNRPIVDRLQGLLCGTTYCDFNHAWAFASYNIERNVLHPYSIEYVQCLQTKFPPALADIAWKYIVEAETGTGQDETQRLVSILQRLFASYTEWVDVWRAAYARTQHQITRVTDHTNESRFKEIFLNHASQFSSDIRVDKNVDLKVANSLYHEALAYDPGDKEAVLSNKGILRALIDKKLRIEPFLLPNLSVAQYDFCLGRYYYRMKKPDLGKNEVYNIYSENDVKSKWQLQEAEIVGGRELEGTKPSDLIIWLSPGETILGHTCEKIGSYSDYTTKMHCRSSIGRSLVRVCACAGLGDCGFANVWTLEIESVAPYPIFLVVGRRIGQITFEKTSEFFKEEGFRSYQDGGGKYDNGNDIWEPNAMLPKLYRDKYV